MRSMAGEAPPSCSCRPGRWCTPASGRPRSVIWQGISAWSPSTGGGTAGPTGRWARRHTPMRSMPPTPWPCSTPPRPRGPSWSACRGASPGRCTWLPTHPDRVAGVLGIGGSSNVDVPRTGRDVVDWEGPATSTEGWAKYNRAVLARGRLRRLRGVLLRARCSASRTPPSRSRTPSAGRSRPPRRPSPTPAPGCTASTASRCTPIEEVCARVSCPVLLVHGTHDAISPPAVSQRIAELTGGSVVLLEGCGHGPVGPPPGRRQPPHPRLRGALRWHSRGDVRPRVRPSWTRADRRRRRGAVPVLPDRAGSRPARPRHRRRAAQAPPRPRDRLAGPAPGDHRPRAGR